MQQPDPRLVHAAWRTARPTQRLLDALMADGRPVRFVGGCVRDTLIGRARPGLDLDLATPEPPDRVLALLARARIKAIPTGLEHGTVTAVVDGEPFEVTTLRRDVETFGRRAKVAFAHDFEVDAARRDFTFNAMSADREGRLFDPFAGEVDLFAGRVRFVGDPAIRIAEDHLRVLRYFRFYAGYGRDTPDAATLRALAAGVPLMDRLAGERVRQELWKLLGAADPRAAVRLMDEVGLLAWLVDGAADRSGLDSLVAVEPTVDAVRRLAALLRGAGEPAAAARSLVARLKPSRADAERLQRLVGLAAEDRTRLDDGGIRRALATLGCDLVLASTLFSGAVDAAAANGFARRLHGLGTPALPLQGRDVLARGVAPGPAVGGWLRAIEQWWLDGGCVADRDACLAELDRRLAESG